MRIKSGPVHERFIIVCVDLYTHFPDVKICGDVTSKTVIEFLKSLFVRYGLVNEITLGNEAQSVSREFEQFVQYNDICHSKCALYHPQSNPVERYN